MVLKQKGQECSDTSIANICHEGETRSLILFMTEFERDMYKMYCHGGILCCDGTYSLNGYGQVLYSINCILNLGTNLTVAHFLTQREDASSLLEVLAILKHEFPDVKPRNIDRQGGNRNV